MYLLQLPLKSKDFAMIPAFFKFGERFRTNEFVKDLKIPDFQFQYGYVTRKYFQWLLATSTFRGAHNLNLFDQLVKGR